MTVGGNDDLSTCGFIRQRSHTHQPALRAPAFPRKRSQASPGPDNSGDDTGPRSGNAASRGPSHEVLCCLSSDSTDACGAMLCGQVSVKQMEHIARHNTCPSLRRRTARVVADKLKLFVLATLVVVLAKAFLLDVVVVQGNSMEPALPPGDCVLVERLTPRLGLLEPGQIVLLATGTPEVLMVKRIVAMGGDRVETRGGAVMVNGEPGPGEEQTIPGNHALEPTIIPAGHVFVLGDNRPCSYDGLDFGPVPATSVKGCVIGGLRNWASVASTRFRVLARAAGWESRPASWRNSPPPPPAVARTLAAMARVKTAHVTVGGERIWISEDHGMRRETKHGFSLYTDEGTWEYDRRQNTVVISRGTPKAGWDQFQRLFGAYWLPPLGCEWSSYEYTVSHDVLDGSPAQRIDTNPSEEGLGATLWVDSRSMRLIALDEWRIDNGARQSTGPRRRVDYDTPIDPQLFVPKIPKGAIVVDRRTGANPSRTRS